jgi:hypothetical protein
MELESWWYVQPLNWYPSSIRQAVTLRDGVPLKEQAHPRMTSSRHLQLGGTLCLYSCENQDYLFSRCTRQVPENPSTG